MAWQLAITVVERTGPTMENSGTTKTTTRTVTLAADRDRPDSALTKFSDVATAIALFRDKATYPLFSATVSILEV